MSKKSRTTDCKSTIVSIPSSLSTFGQLAPVLYDSLTWASSDVIKVIGSYLVYAAFTSDKVSKERLYDCRASRWREFTAIRKVNGEFWAVSGQDLYRLSQNKLEEKLDLPKIVSPEALGNIVQFDQQANDLFVLFQHGDLGHWDTSGTVPRPKSSLGLLEGKRVHRAAFSSTRLAVLYSSPNDDEPEDASWNKQLAIFDRNKSYQPLYQYNFRYWAANAVDVAINESNIVVALINLNNTKHPFNNSVNIYQANGIWSTQAISEAADCIAINNANQVVLAKWDWKFKCPPIRVMDLQGTVIKHFELVHSRSPIAICFDDENLLSVLLAYIGGRGVEKIRCIGTNWE